MHKKILPQDIHICLVSDNNYMVHTAETIASVLYNSNPRDTYHFYILSSIITDKNKKKLKKLRKIRDFTIKYPTIDDKKLEIFKKVKRSAWVPIDTFNRLLMPDLLPNIDKAIFLDSDIVVMQDIAALYAVDVSDCYVAGVEDLNYAGLVRMLGYPKQYTYINSGIYVMNLAQLRKDNYYQQIIDVVSKEYPKYTVAEQCVLNSCFHEHIKLIPHKWNMYHIFLNRPWYNFIPYDVNIWNDGIRNPAIVHFVGPDKPWNYNSTHPYRNEYLKYLRMTPWKSLYYKNKIKRLLYLIFHKEKVKGAETKTSQYFVCGYSVLYKEKTKTKLLIKILGLKIRRKLMFFKKEDTLQPSKIIQNQINGNNNHIYVINKDKRREISAYEKIDGLSINIKGDNNTIYIEEPYKFINSRICFDCNDSYVKIGENSICNTLVILNNGGFSNRNIEIGKNFACWGGEMLLNGRGNSIHIGDDCLFSKEIHIMNGDGHNIFIEGQKIPPAEDVYIGNHVWVGMGVYILKNSVIPDGSIVGAGSVVAKKILQQNVAIAGNPAKIIKTNVNWSR